MSAQPMGYHFAISHFVQTPHFIEAREIQITQSHTKHSWQNWSENSDLKLSQIFP